MNTFDKIRAFCRPFRILIGIILIIVGVAMIDWGFEWNQDITNDKRVGTVVRDIGVMALATGIIFVMQRVMN